MTIELPILHNTMDTSTSVKIIQRIILRFKKNSKNSLNSKENSKNSLNSKKNSKNSLDTKKNSKNFSLEL